MEVFAGFLTHTDVQVARVLEFITELGELDNTIVLLMSDNGASAEGGVNGSFNEQYFFNFVPESIEENLRRIDDLGTPRANNHYPWGWAWAGNTPLKRFKRDTHEGGVADPLIVHWPAGIGTEGETRHQYVHAIDVMPTLLDLIGIEAPEVIAGVNQTPDRRCELRADAARPQTRRARTSPSTTRCSDPVRCTTTAGRPSCSTRRRSSATTAATPRRPFDDDVWELYHVAEDFSEVRDLAAERPDKLAELQALWWQEAERFQVLAAQQRAGPLRRHAVPPRPLRALRRDRAAPRSDRAELPEPFVHHRRGARHPRRGCDRRRDRRTRVACRRIRRVRTGSPAPLCVQLRGYRDHDDRGNRAAPDRAGRGAHRLQSGAR